MTDLPYEIACHSDAREAWLAARHATLGASEVAAVMNDSPWTTALQLYGQKRGELEKDDESEPMFWGTALEAAILHAYQSKRYAGKVGRLAERDGHLLTSVAHPWASCTLDGWTWDERMERWPLEIKTTGHASADDWEEGLPAHYRWQVQHQMLVTGASRVTYACLIGGRKLVWDDVERDEAAIARIIERGSDFMRRVREGEPPPAAGGDNRTIGDLYPERGGTVRLPESLREDVATREALKAQIKKAYSLLDPIEARLKEAIGNAECGRFGDGTVVTWKTQQKAEYTVPASSSRVLRVKIKGG